MILLLCCSKSWSSNDSIPLQGTDKDSTKVLIDISYIRKANIKLIKYKYNNEIIARKDSIIKLQNKQVEIYKEGYDRLKLHNLNIEHLNKSLEHDLEKAKLKNKIYGGVAGGIATSLLLFILIK